MTESALSIVRGISDAEAVRFLQHFGQALFEETSRDAVIVGIPGEIEALDQVKQLMTLDSETRELTIGPDDSPGIARGILMEMARDKQLAPILVSAWNDYESDELFVVEAILASGFVAALLLFMATSEIEGQVLGMKFKKGKSTPEMLRAITEPFFGAIEKLKEQ